MTAPSMASPHGFWPYLPETPSPVAHSPRWRGSRSPAWELSTTRKGGFVGSESTPLSKRDVFGGPGPVPVAGRTPLTGHALGRRRRPVYSFGCNGSPTGRLTPGRPTWTSEGPGAPPPLIGTASASYAATREPRNTMRQPPQFETCPRPGVFFNLRVAVPPHAPSSDGGSATSTPRRRPASARPDSARLGRNRSQMTEGGCWRAMAL